MRPLKLTLPSLLPSRKRKLETINPVPEGETIASLGAKLEAEMQAELAASSSHICDICTPRTRKAPSTVAYKGESMAIVALLESFSLPCSINNYCAVLELMESIRKQDLGVQSLKKEAKLEAEKAVAEQLS